jgi:hypothetical protein
MPLTLSEPACRDAALSNSAAYTVLTLVTMAWMVARILNAELVYEPSYHRHPDETSPPAPQRVWPSTKPRSMPTFSSNDRSRWATVRALVDHGTFAIGEGTFDKELGRYRGGRGFEHGIISEDGWGTVDKMMNPATGRFYSTKPPLLTAVAAAQYAVLKSLFGWSITENPERVVKTILLLTNGVPLLWYLSLLRQIVSRFGRCEWSRCFTFAAGSWGTFVTTFSNTLNNHVPAAIITLGILYFALLTDTTWTRSRISGVGFLAGLLICLELPAAIFSFLIGVGIVRKVGYRALIWGGVAALIPVSAHFILNYLAVGDWLPAYSKLQSPWYQYPGSHWLPPNPGEVKHGIDWARFYESRLAYVFHMIAGHHGWFSLTPIWLLSLVALLAPRWTNWPWSRSTHVLFVAVSVIVIGFYLVATDNYGGWTCGPRWLIWLTPIWLVTLLPTVDRIAPYHFGRVFAGGLLAVSVVSTCYPLVNPWRHPWLYRLMENAGWIHY